MNFAFHKDLGVDEISPPTRYAPSRHPLSHEAFSAQRSAFGRNRKKNSGTGRGHREKPLILSATPEK